MPVSPSLMDVLEQMHCERQQRPSRNQRDECYNALTKLVSLRQQVADERGNPLPDTPELFAEIKAFFLRNAEYWGYHAENYLFRASKQLHVSQFLAVDCLGFDVLNLSHPLMLSEPRRLWIIPLPGSRPVSVTKRLLQQIEVAEGYFQSELEKLNRLVP